MKKMMKKSILSFFLCAFVLCNCLAFWPEQVFAAQTASLNGPQALRAGDTVTVTFKVEGNNIVGMTGTLEYNAAQLTFVSWKQIIGTSWQVEANGAYYMAWDDKVGENAVSSGNLFSVTFKVKADIAVGTVVTISMKDVVLTYNQTQEASIGTVTYQKSIAEPLSANACLGSLSVGYTLSPAFSPDVMSYSVTVPFEVSTLNVTATAEDSKSAVKVNKPYLKANGHTTVTITVTAENGAQKTYSIDVFREQDPNYQPSDDASLKSLSVENFLLSPVFTAERLNYVIWLPYETTSVQVSAVATDNKVKSISVAGGEALEVGPNYVYITVLAEDGETKTVYAITVNRAQDPDYEEEPLPPVEPLSNNATITGVIMETTTDGEKYVNALFGFNPEVYDYNFTLDETVIGFTLVATSEDEAAMVRVLGNMNPEKGETVDVAVLCTAPDGVTTKTYVIHVTRLGSDEGEFEFGILETGVACAVAMALGASVTAAIIGISAAASAKRKKKLGL